MNKFIVLTFLVIFSNNILVAKSQTVTDQTSGTSVGSSSSIPTQNSTSIASSSSSNKPDLTTTPPIDECEAISNVTCQDCLQNEKCFFCYEDNKCKTYKLSGIFPEGCSASKARWISCSLNFQALLIAIICIGVIILLIISCCICYCCSATCKSISDRNLRRVERKILKQRDFLRQKNEARKQERQQRNEAIRVKYGLKPSTYTPMD